MLMWLLIVPAVAGGITYVCGRRARWLTHALTVLTAGWLVMTTGRLLSATGLEWEAIWGKIWQIDVSLAMKVTAFGVIAGLFVSGFGLLVSLYSISYVSRDIPLGRHHAYMLWALAGSLGALLANDLIFFLVSWEIVTVMLYLLIGLAGEKARAGAAKTFAILGLADCALLLGIALIVAAMMASPGGEAVSLKMDGLRLGTDSGLLTAAYLLMLVGALAKAGAVPFHTWLPSAAEGATCEVLAFLPASLDKLLGIFLLARISLEFFVIGRGLKILLMAIGAVTILAAVMMAMVQHNLKKLLSFHAISQVGYMVLGIGTGSVAGIVGGIFHMFNNAIYKSALFLSAGSVEKATGTTELDRLGGLARVMPVTFVCTAIAAMAISGVPPLNGFASKWLVYQGTLDAARETKWAGVFLAAAVFGSALTLASFVKVLHSVFLGQRGSATKDTKPAKEPISIAVPLVVLAVFCVLFGVFAGPTLNSVVIPSVESISAQTAGLDTAVGVAWYGALWRSGPATGMLILGIIIGVVIYFAGSGFKVRVDRTYVGGEVIDPATLHASGTGFYNTVRKLPGLGPVFRDAERESFDVYHIAGRYGSSLVEMLRAAHTGKLTLYVSWVLAGLVILIVCLLGASG